MNSLKRIRTLFSTRYLTKRSLDVRYALVEACGIGLFSALAALFLKEGIRWLGGWRIQAANAVGDGLALPIAGLLFGGLAGLIVEQLSPEAAGGGIPQVKAVLARFSLPLNLRVAIVKTVSTVLLLGGAGLTLGRRGPTVHIGAALAAQLSRWVPTSPEHRRQMIASGAAAGLAAGFNTPIAGVLFVVEELMRDISGLTLETAILASFVGAVVSRRILGTPDEMNLPVTMLDAAVQRGFSAQEIPFYILLGVLAGVLGGLFNRGVLFSIAVNRRLRLGMPWRIGLAGLISGAVIAALPPVFRDNAGLREFLMMSEGDWQITVLVFVVHFLLTLLAYGSGAPGGLFAPALVLGSALGFLVGNVQELLLGVGSSNTYALAGMGAFFTAVVRVPVTAIVIVFEMTTDFNLVLPLMIVSAVAYVVAESVSSGSLYEHLLEPSGIQLDSEIPNNMLTRLKADDVMQSQVEVLASDLTIDDVLQTISRSPHRGFPVVEEGKLVGIVDQENLTALAQKSGQTLKEVMTPQPITICPTASLSEVLYLLNRYQLNRLPVVEGRAVVGIITHSDIIRAEAKQLSGDSPSATAPAPSYVVYQTHSPATGKGRLLLPLANPQTAADLLEIAIAIASYYHYELECLQVIEIPKHCFPDRTPVNTLNSRRLLRRVEKLGRARKIPVHTQIKVAPDAADAILETIAQRHINIVLTGWKGSTSTQGAVFGNVVDTLIRKAACDLLLVKPGEPLDFQNISQKWLIPIAGGPNAQRALEFLPALTAHDRRHESNILLCQVHSPDSPADTTNLKKTVASLQEQLKLPITPVPIRSHTVADAVICLAMTEKCDVVMLGASREGLLQQVVRGNIPRAIAREVSSTVILVRGAFTKPRP
ncbi:MAG: chloride channel protein [Cyanophyceae cyanobacterium]